MANWKKVIVSGSNAHLNHITASGNISASGFLYGNLPTSDSQYVVIYNTTTGRLEYKLLNLVSTREAPGLFLADINTDSNTSFKLSYDTGSSAVGGVVFSYTKLSASIDGGSSYGVSTANNIDWIGINDTWTAKEPTNTVYYSAGGLDVNITGSISGSRNGLREGTSKEIVRLNLQAIDATDTAVPLYNSADVPNYNYLAQSFTDGLSGSIEVYFNDNAAPVIDQSIESATAINTTTGGVTLDLSAARQNLDGDGNTDTLKVARSGSVSIAAADQQDGYNFCYIIHTGSVDGVQFCRITNFNEWFYDLAGAAQAMAEVGTATTVNPTFNASEVNTISGIKFFNGAAADSSEVIYRAQISNQYRNIYRPTGGIRFSNITGDVIDTFTIDQSGSYQVYSQSLHTVPSNAPGQTITADLSDLENTATAYTSTTRITASLSLDFGTLSSNFYQPSTFEDNFDVVTQQTNVITSTNNEINFTANFDHITDHKSNLPLTTVNINSYLINKLSANATINNYEDFKDEGYRIISRSYSTGDTNTPDHSTYNWDSTQNLVTGTAGHNSGSLVFFSHLLYPTGAGSPGGDFSTTLGPASQPDYTTTTGNREYYRYFKFTTGTTGIGSNNINLEFVGSGKICREDDSTNFTSGGNGIKVYIWRSAGGAGSDWNDPGFHNVLTNSTREGSNFTIDDHFINIPSNVNDLTYDDNDYTLSSGATQITAPNGTVRLNDSNGAAFSTDEFVVVRIVCPQNWTGNIDAMACKLGVTSAGTSTIIGTKSGTQL